MKSRIDSRFESRWNKIEAPRFATAPKKSPVLILVSGDKDYIAMLKPVLTRSGFQVKVASSERDAFCLTYCITPLVILVDSKIGSGNGEVIVTRLKNTPHLGKTPIYMARSVSTQTPQKLNGSAASPNRVDEIQPCISDWI
jgi:CheY-like chemotaxis protein